MRTIRFQSLYQVITKSEFVEKMINYLNKLLELKSLELHVEEVRKTGNKIKTGDKE